MDKNKALQTLGGISSALENIPVTGKQNLMAMVGVLGALEELAQWIYETVGDANDAQKTNS